MRRPARESLYQRIGGYDALVKVLDRVCADMIKDERLETYFKGHNEQSKRRLRQRFVDYVCEAAGGPVFYTGLDLRTAHQGLGINETDWEVFMKEVSDSLRRYKVAKEGQDGVISMLEELKAQIVEDR